MIRFVCPQDEKAAVKWCGRGESNPHGLSPSGFSYQLRLSPPRRGVRHTRRVCGLDYPFTLPRKGRPRVRCCPSSLYTFPAGAAGPGLARDCHLTGFPEFEQFCTAGFPTGTQRLKSAASTNSATPA